MDYFIYLVDRTGHIFARREIDCDTVEEAIAFARTLAIPPEGKLEIWLLSTHLATISA
jgi:hypothetical protein